MKRFLLLLLTGTLCIQTNAQVINDDTYNMEIHFTRGWGQVDEESGDSEPTFLVKVREDTGKDQNELLDHSSGAANSGATCYYYNTNGNAYGPVVDYNLGTFTNSTGRYDYEVFTYEDDGGQRCRWDSGDDNRSWEWNWVYATNSTQSEWYSKEYGPNSYNGTYYTLKHTWRYSNGQYAGSALDFGTITSGTKYHTNSNRSAPSGASSSLGYSNAGWTSSPFTLGNDVTYRFELTSSKRVTISTDYSTTDFDTHIHLVSLNEAGTTYGYIEGDDDDGSGTKSVITRDLCPGYYGVVVEGHSSYDEGDFQLSVGVSSLTVNPGSIARSGAEYICPNATLSYASNSSSGSSTLGGVTYSWEKNTYNGTSWSGWNSISGTGTTNSNLGTLTSNIIAIRRKASDCGSTANSNIIYYRRTSTSAIGGVISGSKTIPYPHEVSNGSISNTTSASASPSAIISWEKNDGGGWQTISGAISQSYTLPSTITTTTQYRRKVKSSCTNPEVATYSNEVEVKVINPNGVISGHVKDRNGINGIQGITITAKRITAVEGGEVNHEYTTVTGNGGAFDIPGVYYGDIAPGSGDQATFEVTPSKEGHAFDPDMTTVIVRQTLPQPANLLFKDTTGFVIAGTVTQKCYDCEGATQAAPKIYPLPGVTMLESMSVGANPTNNQTTTGNDGKYATIKEFEGNYIIKPEYETHQFKLHQRTVSVGGANGVEVNNIDFEDTTTHVISGVVIIPCTDFYIGRATLTFSQVLPDDEGGNPVSPVFQKTITTNAGSGAYSVRLPAAKYRVSVGGFSEVPTGKDLVGDEMKNFLNAYPDSIRVRDITNVDTTLNLYFHESPQIQVVGLAGPDCAGSPLAGGNDLSDKPIFVQNEPRTFMVKIWEGRPEKACPAQDSTLIISTNIQVDDVNEQIDTMTVDAEIELTLTGGIPNIIPPHHKTLAFAFTDIWERSAENVVMTPVVTGVKANIGSFATVSPEIPFLILRDPPGDESFSFWEENNTVSTANRFYDRTAGSLEVWGKVKVGVETQNGLGVSIKSKVWGELGGSLITSGANKSSEEVILTTTNSQRYTTSNSEYVTGEKGDVYIGAAMNLKYAVSNEVIYSPDTCSFYLKKFLMISNEGFATRYTYSEHHIKNTLIPTLKMFRDNPGNSQAQKEEYADQISVWEQVIENNKELKRKAKFKENISFDGASGQITSSTTATATSTSSIEFNLEIDAGVATELGLELGGAGVSGGVKTRIKMETGEAKTVTNTQTTTTGFTISDKNIGDYFTIDVKTDPVYATPVFDMIAGTSSCPTEPGTQPRYEVSLTAPNPVISGIPANATAIFDLNIGNTSQSEERRTYYLRYINGSGNGATISNDGNPFIIPFQYDLDYLQQTPISIGVTRFNQNVYGFENIRFEAIDACRGKDTPFPITRKEVSISAFFANGCSPITLASPENGFVLTQSFNNLLPLNIKDYNYNNLDEIVVEYSKVGNTNWVEAVVLSKAQIANSSFGTQLNLNVGSMADGAYNFRLKLKCGLDVVYSQRVTGVFDRKGPEQFGLPQPADDVYALGDEISMSFTEPLGCSSFNASHFAVTRLSNNSSVPAVLGCFNNKIIITPSVDILQYLGDSIRVDLMNITDQYGNPAQTNYAWEFNIGAQEIDATTPYYTSLNSASPAFGVSSTSAVASTSITEDALGTLNVNFSVSQTATDSILVYFIVAGTATYGVDYTVSGAHNYNGNEGSIYIPKGGLLATLQIDPTADNDLESDESIILGILSGGDYNIGGSNKVTLTILNDDQDDCENGGLAFNQPNNTNGNTSLSAGTYHKLLLESDALVNSPTTVIFKGERSIVLKPGFEVQSGSVFTALQEDCPNLASSEAFESKLRQSSENDIFSYAVNNANPVSQNLRKSTEVLSSQKIAENGIVHIPFTSRMEQNFGIKLFGRNAAEVQSFNSDKMYKSGENSFQLESEDIEAGVYFMRFEGLIDGEVSYHKILIN